MTPRYSVVIPAYNEEKLLGRLLDSLDVARAAYGNADAIEVIVADNVSTDRTAEIARTRGCRVASVEKRVIAAVRNAGARAAVGEHLAFVDADTQVHPRTFVEIDKALATGRVVGGATGATLERRSLGIAMVYLTLVPIALLTGMDTGVVFVRKQDFEDTRRLRRKPPRGGGCCVPAGLEASGEDARAAIEARHERQGHRLDAEVRRVRRLAHAFAGLGRVSAISSTANPPNSPTGTGTSPSAERATGAAAGERSPMASSGPSG